MLDTLSAGVRGQPADEAAVIAAVGDTLANPALDSAFIAEAVLLPSEAFIGDQLDEVDPERIHQVREHLRVAMARNLSDLWQDAYARSRANRYEYGPAAKG